MESDQNCFVNVFDGSVCMWSCMWSTHSSYFYESKQRNALQFTPTHLWWHNWGLQFQEMKEIWLRERWLQGLSVGNKDNLQWHQPCVWTLWYRQVRTTISWQYLQWLRSFYHFYYLIKVSNTTVCNCKATVFTGGSFVVKTNNKACIQTKVYLLIINFAYHYCTI